MSCEMNTIHASPTTYNIINAFTNTCTRAPYELIDIVQHPSNLTRVFDIDSQEDLTENSALSPVTNIEVEQGLPCNNAAYLR
jgi:hypothetical protein